jgi:tetraprenyl-beta-curcumene synthase
MVAPMRGGAVSLGQFLAAAQRYWLGVFPVFVRELQRWQTRALRIENATLRSLALDAQRSKRRSLEGAVAFAVFAPRNARRRVIRALVSYQVIFDFLDGVSEEPHDDPVRNGRQLNRAMLAALDPRVAIEDYYLHRSGGNDGGYLVALVEECRRSLAELRSFESVRFFLRRAVERNVTYQSLNHGDSDGSHNTFDEWARAQSRHEPGLLWWETGAAAGSSLAVLALIGGAASTLTPREARAVDAAYHPWICALHTMLDSLLDRDEDRTAAGHRSLIDYYASEDDAAARLGFIATEALRRARELPIAGNHQLLLAAMASYYLTELAPSTRSGAARREVLHAIGAPAAPTIAVMHARRLADRAVRTQARGRRG